MAPNPACIALILILPGRECIGPGAEVASILMQDKPLHNSLSKKPSCPIRPCSPISIRRLNKQEPLIMTDLVGHQPVEQFREVLQATPLIGPTSQS